MSEQVAFVWQKTFRQGFAKFEAATGKDLEVFMLEVMRVFVETCYHWTAPPTKGNKGARGGREGGNATIVQDMRWIFSEVSQAYLQMLEERFGPGPIVGKEFRRKDGSVYLIDNVYVNRSGDVASMFRYQQTRRKANGRTLTHAGSVDKEIGRWRPRDKMLVPEGQRAAYIKDVQKRVGKMKAGWTQALKAVNSPRLPAGWVGKAGAISGASGVASGSFSNHIAGYSGYLEAVNNTPYMRDHDGFVKRAAEYTEKFMHGKRFEDWVDKMIKKHGAAPAGGPA